MEKEELEFLIDNKIRENNIYIHTLCSQDKINKYICSFLNTSGGRLIFGISDDGLNISVKKSVFPVSETFMKTRNIFPDYMDKIQYGRLQIEGNNIEYIEVKKTALECNYNNVVYYFNNEKREPEEKKTVSIFLSYCQKDKGIADIVDKRLPEIENRIEITRDIRVVNYRERFSEFMQTISEKDFVLSIVSDRYLKSRNCMYEMSELMRDRKFADKLLFVVVSDEDIKYCNEENTTEAENSKSIGAHIYEIINQTKYILHWQKQESDMIDAIKAINDPILSGNQNSELEIIKKIQLNLRDIMKDLSDRKGISFEEMLKTDFADIISVIRNKIDSI